MWFLLVMSNTKKLSEMIPGEIGTIVSLIERGIDSIKLQEMGILPGTIVRYVRSAPMGGPLQIELLGYQLSLRKVEAANVMIALS